MQCGAGRACLALPGAAASACRGISVEQGIFRCETAVSQWHLGAQNYGSVGHSKAAG